MIRREAHQFALYRGLGATSKVPAPAAPTTLLSRALPSAEDILIPEVKPTVRAFRISEHLPVCLSQRLDACLRASEKYPPEPNAVEVAIHHKSRRRLSSVPTFTTPRWRQKDTEVLMHFLHEPVQLLGIADYAICVIPVSPRYEIQQMP